MILILLLFPFINSQRYTSVLKRANAAAQKNRNRNHGNNHGNNRPVYYGNTYSHVNEPNERNRNYNNYGGGGFGSGPSGGDPCGGNANIILRPGKTAEIRSPNFPNGMRNLQRQCSWKIQSPMGTRIKMTFDEFRLHTSSPDYCTDAHLEVRDDYMGAGTNFKMCKNSPGVLITKRNQVQLTLQNGPTGNLHKQGFLMTLQATREPMSNNIPPYGQSLITMTQLKAVPQYEYEVDYYTDYERYEDQYDYQDYLYEEAEDEEETDNTVYYQVVFLVILLVGAGVLTWMIYRKHDEARKEKEYVEKHSGQLPGT